MSDYASIARPYAKAAFEWALQANAVAAWSDFLTTAAMASEDAQFRLFSTNPKVTTTQVADVLLGVCGDTVAKNMENFIRLLARKHRLFALSDIAHVFADFRDKHDKISAVTVVSAMPILEEQQSRLQAALKIRLQREVTVQYQIDETLVGGALVRVGDHVIDGTVQGKLQRLVSSLSDTALGVVDV